MKVLRVSSSYYPATKYGGSITAEYNLDKELSKTLQFDVATTNAGLDTIEVKKWKQLDDIHIIYLPFVGYEHFNLSFSYLWFLINNVKKYDLLHISGVWNFPVLLAPIVARYFNIPYVMTLHGALFESAFNAKKNHIKKYLFKHIVKKNLLYASCIHLTTQKEKDELNKLIDIDLLQTVIIPFGISNLDLNIEITKIEKFKEKFKILEDEKIILFVGRIHPIKGLDLLVKSFNLLIKQRQDIKLMIVGPDDVGYQKDLLALIDNDALSKVCFTGMLEGIEKELAFASADLFVLPSYSENLGMVVIEAMQHKLPIVITQNVGIGSFLNGIDGIDIIDYDEQKLKNIMLKKMEQNVSNEAIKKTIYQAFEENFSLKAIGVKFINMYKSLFIKDN